MVWVTPKVWNFGEIGITSDTFNQHIRDNQDFLNARQAGLSVANSLFTGETSNNRVSTDVIIESTPTFDTNGSDVIGLFNISVGDITGTGTPVETSLVLESVPTSTEQVVTLTDFKDNEGLVSRLTVFTNVAKATYKLTLRLVVPVSTSTLYTIQWNYLYLAAIETI